MIKCIIWKLCNGCYRITVNDTRYRKLDTACITDIDILFKSMNEISQALKTKENVDVLFEIEDKTDI